MFLDEAHEGPFADEAHVLLEVAEEERGVFGLGLDEGFEVEDHRWLLPKLHYPVKFGDTMVGLLLRPPSAARFVTDPRCDRDTWRFPAAKLNRSTAKHRSGIQMSVSVAAAVTVDKYKNKGTIRGVLRKGCGCREKKIFT